MEFRLFKHESMMPYEHRGKKKEFTAYKNQVIEAIKKGDHDECLSSLLNMVQDLQGDVNMRYFVAYIYKVAGFMMPDYLKGGEANLNPWLLKKNIALIDQKAFEKCCVMYKANQKPCESEP